MIGPATRTSRRRWLRFETLDAVPIALDEGLQGERAVAIAHGVGWPAGEAFACFELAGGLGPRGAYGRALELAERGLDIAREIGHRQWEAGSRATLGALMLDLCLLPAAREHAEAASATARETGSSTWSLLAAAVLAGVYVRQGDKARAAALLGGGDAAAHPHHAGVRLCRSVRAEVALACRDGASALALVDEPRDGCDAAVEFPANAGFGAGMRRPCWCRDDTSRIGADPSV